MSGGQGGFIAADLSGYAPTRSVDEIRGAIVNPHRQGKSVVAITVTGDKYAGIARNEDNFSLQVQGLDGTFYLLMKSELSSLEFQSQSLMPSDYSSTLTNRELDDLISFLVHSAQGSQKAPAAKQEE